MKKFFLSVGLVAVGTASLQAAYAPDQGSMDATRMWSLAGSLRGFYDNNYTTGNSPDGSGGFEVSPSLSINIPMQQTEFGMRFTYGLYYYTARANENQDPIDQSFRTDLWLDHAFTERWQVRVEDTFLISQSPDLNTGGPVSNPFRTTQSFIANNGAITLNTTWTRRFSTSLSYNSDFYDYENDNGTAANPSLAGTLNRIGNTVGINFNWIQSPTTTFFVGYNFSQVNYTGDEPIGAVAFPAPPPFPLAGYTYYSDSRNVRSQAVFLGASHSFTPNLTFSGQAGAQYSDYYNDPQDTTSLNPYGNLSLSYTYRPGCFAEIGFNQSMNSTDVIAVDGSNGSVTLSQESSVIYGSITHKITPKLMGSLIGQVQFSSYDSGAYANDLDTLYTATLNFSYAFNRYFSADIGNSFDSLNSSVPGRPYSRNRVYAGVTATY